MNAECQTGQLRCGEHNGTATCEDKGTKTDFIHNCTLHTFYTERNAFRIFKLSSYPEMTMLHRSVEDFSEQ